MRETAGGRLRDPRPLVSVVIPTYNRWPLVAQAVDSVLAQDYQPFEVIVVDDGSTDGTEQELKGRYGPEIRYVRQDNQGPSAARNSGLALAEGAYVAFLDSDDIWLPGKLTRQVPALERRPGCGLAYSPCLVATDEGESTGRIYGSTDRGATGDNFVTMLRHHAIMTSAVLVTKRALDDVGAFDPHLRTGQDTDMWLRITMRYPAVFVPGPLALMREHAGQWSHGVTESGERWRAHAYLYRKLLEELPPSRANARPLIDCRLAEAQLGIAQHEAVEFDRERTTGQFGRVLREHPGIMDHYEAWEAVIRVVRRFADNGTEVGAADMECLGKSLCSLDSPTRHVRNRRMAKFYCALARQSLGHAGLASAMRSGRAALRASPAEFVRSLLLPGAKRLSNDLVLRRLGVVPRAT